MNFDLKFTLPNTGRFGCLSPYQEIAIYVRELLQCDYALVAVPDLESIRIRAVAGPEAKTLGLGTADLIKKVRDWGPVVVDESRLIAVPVPSADRVLGILIGYSATPGAFTAADLEKLMTYGNVAGAILANASVESQSPNRRFGAEELVHFSRLMTAGELSACFAHDVVNPLTLIRTQVRLLQDALPADHQLRMNCNAIDGASRQIQEMTRRLAELADKTSHSFEPCEASELISDAMRFVQPFLRSPFIAVQVQVGTGLPVITVNRWQVVHAIVNVFRNSVDAMVNSHHRLLSVNASVLREHMRIVISDTGCGIPSRNLPKVFDPLFTTKGHDSSGLGLYITKLVIEEHRGSIEIHSINGGTTVMISLPL